MNYDVDVQCLGHGINGYVIMCRTNAAGSKQVVIGSTQSIYRVHDPIFTIGYDAHLCQPDTLHLQP